MGRVVTQVTHVQSLLHEHAVPKVRRVVEQGRLWAAGFALVHVSVLVAAGLRPEWHDWLDFGLPDPPLLGMAIVFVLVSLGPIWVTIARVSRTRLVWEEQCAGAETEVAEAIESEKPVIGEVEKRETEANKLSKKQNGGYPK